MGQQKMHLFSCLPGRFIYLIFLKLYKRFPQDHGRLIWFKSTKCSRLALSFGPLISLGEAMDNGSMENSGNVAGLSGNPVFKSHTKYLTVWQDLHSWIPKRKA